MKAAVAPASGAPKRLLLLGAGTVVIVALGLLMFVFLADEPPTEPPVVRKAVAPAATVGEASAPTARADSPVEKSSGSIEVSGRESSNSIEATPASSRAGQPAQGGVAAPSSPAIAEPLPSSAFNAWAQNLRISGVAGGANPRVLIGNTAYAPGDLVNPQLGVRFVSYDPVTRVLVFRDGTGATVERRH